jgi:hypothetical protein
LGQLQETMSRSRLPVICQSMLSWSRKRSIITT